MPTSQQTQEICVKFQRALKNKDFTDTNKLSLEELQDADIDLGSLDLYSKHRLAIKSRIQELKERNVEDISQKKHSQIFIISIITITITVLIAIIGWCFFSTR
ncbi:TPA: hypothetical protein ACGYSL_001668 [Legionella pneumophila]